MPTTFDGYFYGAASALADIFKAIAIPYFVSAVVGSFGSSLGLTSMDIASPAIFLRLAVFV